MRQIVLDTETTGLEPADGHRIIEIGCVELVNRRLTGNHYHQYLQPDRQIDPGAVEVHGITNEFLQEKPRFADVVEDLIAFVRGSELVIHNAPFDVGFLNHELNLLGGGWPPVAEICGVLDTLTMARRLHPGQKNNLDALCKRYGIDNSQREKHGALLDAEILADVYLAMTGGQVALSLGSAEAVQRERDSGARTLDPNRPALRVVRAADHELAEHAKRLEAIDEASNGGCVWKKLDW
jgi:DNA polymerase-3 subunit epsilon